MLTQRNILILSTIAFTLLALVWSGISGRLINFDGILYLRSADALLAQDYSTAYSIYRWPFYSILIAFTSKATGFGLVNSAYILNGLLQIILSLAFIKLVKQLGGNQRMQWIALIVLIANPFLNDYRCFISRDFGYWAFFLVSLNFLIAAANDAKYRYAVFAGFALAFSTLFRIEGLAFALILPIAFLFLKDRSWRDRFLYWFFASLPLFLGLVLIVVLINLSHTLNIRGIGRMDHVLNVFDALPIITDNVGSIIGQMKASVLDYQSQRGASVIVIAGLLGLLLFEIIKVTNPFFFLLAGYAAKRHYMPRSFGKRLCKLTLLINLLILLYFIGTFAFLSGRYVMPIALVLLLWVPFTIDHIYHYFCVCSKKSIKYWYYPATAVILAGFIGYNIAHLHNDKAFIRNAGHWAQKYVADETPLKSNSAEFLFYSRGIIKDWDSRYQPENDILLAGAGTNQIIALRLNKKQALKLMPSLHQWRMLATFHNDHGDTLVIIQRNKRQGRV